MSPRPEGEQAGLEAVRSHLVELGVPEQVPTTCRQRTCPAWRGLRVEVEVTEEPFNDGREVRVTSGNYTELRTEYDVKELKVTNLAVELPGKRWKIITTPVAGPAQVPNHRVHCPKDCCTRRRRGCPHGGAGHRTAAL